MNKFRTILFFECLLSYILSVKITEINSTNAILGENATFILTVQDYNPDFLEIFSLRDEKGMEIYLNCKSTNNTSLTCDANLKINNLKSINNLTKTLYVNEESTGLTVTINKPTTLKVLDFYFYYEIYSYGVSTFYLDLNYIELYNSSVSIKFGDISITNCEKNKEYNYINCKHEFPESYNEKTLHLIFNDQQTDYSITIKSPPVFSVIKSIIKDIYFRSSSSQDIYFDVDSSYKMNDKKIVLVPETNNSNITLNNCTFFGVGIRQAKCSGILDTIDNYYYMLMKIILIANFLFIQNQLKLMKYITLYQTVC